MSLLAQILTNACAILFAKASRKYDVLKYTQTLSNNVINSGTETLHKDSINLHVYCTTRFYHKCLQKIFLSIFLLFY